MDIDDNDLLFSNKFIKEPELNTEVPEEFNDEFRKYYKLEMDKLEMDKKETQSKKSTNSITNNTDLDDIIYTNKIKEASFTSNENNGQGQQRQKKEIKTYISVDSRDRDKKLYKKPSFFKIFLGRTFYNVKSIKLASIEFPNTNAVINSTNNKIYWRNQQDIDLDIIDTITNAYPIYNVDLRIGSYIASTLQTEISTKIQTIKRKNKLGDFHYFIVDLDIETDIVTFTSLIVSQLGVNPINVTGGLNLVNVTVPSTSNMSNGDIYYMVGAKQIAGIPSSDIDGAHEITIINSTTIQFEVLTKASDTVQGGGNTLKIGKLAPFQLLFGENNNTIAPNIGFPYENSALRFDTYISSMNNFYQAKITTKTPHNFIKNYDYIGQICTISNSGTTQNLAGIRVISDITSSTTFCVSLNSVLSIPSYNTGTITFNGLTYEIQSIDNLSSNTVLLTTFTDHNYTFSDIGKSITLYNTTTIPVFDGSNLIYNILSSTQIVLLGYLQAESSSITQNIGSMPRNNPLTTHTLYISSIVVGTPTFITCTNEHNLKIGDVIQFSNVNTTPSLAQKNYTFSVYSIPSLDTFTINYTTNSYDTTTIDLGSAYVKTGLITVSLPNHNFNKITSIQNTSGTPSSSTGNLLLVQTQLPNTFTTGNVLRIMETNSTPIIDDGYIIDSIIDTDEFTIPLPYPLSSPSTSGIIGFDQDFYLYGSTTIGGLPIEAINNKKYTVRDIIDENTFTFYIQNAFATSSETGGGNSLYISSLLHGFDGIQTNTKNSLLNRSINLEGENYVFLCCPQLNTMLNTGQVKDIFARIILDQSPGMMVFNYLSNPKTFDTVPLNSLNEMEFSIANYNGTLYEFNDLDYSFTLEITEIIDTVESFNYSSRRGITSS